MIYPREFSRADETTYLVQGWRVARHGVAGLRQMAELHAYTPDAPSPLRWGWLFLVALALRVGSVEHRSIAILSSAGHVACAVLAGLVWAPAAGVLVLASPLGLTLGRRALGDTWAALLCLALLATPPGPARAAAAFAALAVKESNAMAVLALVCPWALAGTGAWTVASVAVLGPRVAWTLARRARAQGDTDYSRAEQRGMPHRVIVDLMLVSPAIVLASVFLGSAPRCALLWLGLCAIAPLKNARLLLGVDLALRVALAPLVSGEVLFCLVAIDLAIAWRIRDVYDPTTRNLVGAVCRSIYPLADRVVRPCFLVERASWQHERACNDQDPHEI